MYLDTDAGNIGVSNNIDFIRSTERQVAAGFTGIFDIGNYSLLYYNINTGFGMTIERSSLAAIKGNIPFAAGWTNIVKLNRSRILFYNNNTGKAVVTNNSNFNTLDEPGFSPWTHITPLNEDMLCFYNDKTGVTLITDMKFNNLSPVKTLPKSYTQVVDIDNDNILFYNATNGDNFITKATDLSITAITRKDFSSGWTNIVNAGDSKILFYNKNNNTSAVLDNTFTQPTNINPIEKCHVITAYKSTSASQEGMVSQSMYVGGTISGVIALPQSVLQNSNIRAKYKVVLYEVTDHPTDGSKYTYKAEIKINNTANASDLPAGSNAYSIPYKFTKVPLYKRFVVAYGDLLDFNVKVDLRPPLYIAIKEQQDYILTGAFFANNSTFCKSCIDKSINGNVGLLATDKSVKICTKANPALKNDINMYLVSNFNDK